MLFTNAAPLIFGQSVSDGAGTAVASRFVKTFADAGHLRLELNTLVHVDTGSEIQVTF